MEEELWNVLIAPWKAAKPTKVYNAVGCLECHMTGYQGRSGIYEILTMTPGLRKLVTPDYNLALVREQATRDGMKALRINGAMKIAAGITTADEVLKVAPPLNR